MVVIIFCLYPSNTRQHQINSLYILHIFFRMLHYIILDVRTFFRHISSPYCDVHPTFQCNYKVTTQHTYLLVVWQDLGANIAPSDPRKTANSESSSKFAPPFGRLQRIPGDVAPRQGFDANLRHIVLKSNSPICRQAQGQDNDQPCCREASRNFSDAFQVAERPKLDEGANQQESVGEPNLYAAEQRRNAGAVCWEVGQVVCNDGGRCDWSFQHSNKGVTVDGLDHLQNHE
jgi:hypothetical protein